MKNNKIILIGIDGGTWSAISPLIEQKKLPNIAKLIKNGSHGKLHTNITYSPSSWTNIATGKKSDKHGISNFYIKDKGKQIKVNSSMVKAKRIWKILSDRGMKVGVYNWLFTWPKEEVNGFIIPSWFSASQKGTYYPPEIRRFSKIYHILRMLKCFLYWQNKGYEKKAKQAIGGLTATDIVISNSLFLMNKYPDLDFFTLCFYPNLLQYKFWRDLFHDRYKVPVGELQYRNVIPKFYMKVDSFIGKIMRDENGTVIIVSDHGVEGFPPNLEISLQGEENLGFKFYLERLLQKMGLLTFTKNKEIRWDKTIAFPYKQGNNHKIQGICINLRGRNPKGIVASEDYEQIRESIIDRFSQIRLSETGEKIIKHIYKSDYPDIVLNDFLKIKYKDAENLLKKTILVDDKAYKLGKFFTWWGIYANHRPEVENGYQNGILIMKGRSIRENKQITGARNIDITPTILYLRGLPIGKDMDGRILTEAITPEYLSNYPVKYIQSYETSETGKKSVIKPSLDDATKEKLKSLGYIS